MTVCEEHTSYCCNGSVVMVGVLARLLAPLKQDANTEAYEQCQYPDQDKRTQCRQNASCEFVAVARD
jgi:hypothetical protein